MLETLTKENWTKYLGENFQVDAGNFGSLVMKLAAVSGYGQRQGGNREAFSLLFCGPLRPVLPQHIYRIGHAGIGELDIFLVPVGPQVDGLGYEAVFT
jgi:hypothetical protein